MIDRAFYKRNIIKQILFANLYKLSLQTQLKFDTTITNINQFNQLNL